jgi:hypothetical protein
LNTPTGKLKLGGIRDRFGSALSASSGETTFIQRYEESSTIAERSTRDARIEGIPSEEWESRKKDVTRRTQYERYQFIDQFRGLTVLFLAISWITWELGKLHLVPPIIDYGWQFFDIKHVAWNWLDMENQFYTIIDLGSSLFMFILGVRSRSRSGASSKSSAPGEGSPGCSCGLALSEAPGRHGFLRRELSQALARAERHIVGTGPGRAR